MRKNINEAGLIDNTNITEDIDIIEDTDINIKSIAMSNKKISFKKEIYLKEIYPLILKIKLICRKNNIPMFTTFCIHPEGGEKGYETENMTMTDFISPQSVKTTPTKDYIAECIKVINGYSTYLPETNDSIDMTVDEDEYEE